jgi:glycosyltransferase involved in cell wall biosynthesis
MPLKILHLCSNRWHSAITEYAINATRALNLAGHANRLGLISGTPGAKYASQFKLDLRTADSFSLADAHNWRQVVSSFDPDVVITYGGAETTLVKTLPLRRDTRVVRFRGQDNEAAGIIHKLRFALGHGHVSALLAPSEFAAARIHKLTKKPVHVVPLGIDANRFKPHVTAGDRRDVVILGRFDPVKGHARALSIFQKAVALGAPAPRLHIIGEPKNVSVAELEAMRDKLGLTHAQVKITAARVPGIDRVLSEAALGWVPSLGSEVICRVAEEFLLCGTPIIVSGVGSLPELITPKDGADYAGLGDDEAALLLRTWWELSRKEGAEAKEDRAVRARSQFSLEQMGNELSVILSAAKDLLN